MKLPVAGPWITEKEVAYVAEAAEKAWYADANVYNERFETAFAGYVGRRFAVTLPSCTSGLHLSLAALGIGPGDEVVIPDVTWIASAAPIAYVGATPVFADVDAESWCVTPASIEAVLTPRTRALIAVDLYGNLPDMDGVLELARRRGIAVVEDAAEAVGSEYKGRRAGSFGAFSAFSFHGSKTLTTGEGGMLATDDEALHRRVLALRDHGRAPGDRSFRSDEVGFKYKMSSLQAALGLAQLERIDELVARKREIFGWYAEAFAGAGAIRLNAEPADVLSSYWMVIAIPDEKLGVSKWDVMSALGDAGIDSRPMFDPLSSIPAYEGTPEAEAARERNRVAYAITPAAVNLPSGFNLSRADVARVVERFRDVVEQRG